MPKGSCFIWLAKGKPQRDVFYDFKGKRKPQTQQLYEESKRLYPRSCITLCPWVYLAGRTLSVKVNKYNEEQDAEKNKVVKINEQWDD